jgi:NDP-sugar pyrophosphorylase family protein
MGTDNKQLSALILVGGKGTRLQSVVHDRPKPMAEVAGRPFLERIVSRLYGQHVGRIIFCTGYLGDVVERHFGSGEKWKMEFEYSRDPSPLGTAGAVRRALERVQSDDFLIINGDSYCEFDVGRLVEVHSANNATATMWLVQKDDCRRYGSVVIDEKGAVLDFREKSPQESAGLINAGVYLFTRKTAGNIPSGRAVSMELEVLPSLIGKGLYAVRDDGPFIDIGTPESYAKAESFFQADY